MRFGVFLLHRILPVPLVVEETLDLLGRGHFELLLLLDDLRETREAVDLRVHVVEHLFFELIDAFLPCVLLHLPVVFQLLVARFQLVAVEMHERDEPPLLLGDQRIGHENVGVEDALDLFGVDVLAAGAHDHVFEPPLDVKPTVGREPAQVAGAEPAVGCEDFGRLLGILVVAQHDARRERHDLALLRIGRFYPCRNNRRRN